MKAESKVDRLLDAYRQRLKAGTKEPDCQALIETLKDPSKMRRLIALEAEVLAPRNRQKFGELVLLDAIGEGGMGQVYRARHRKLGRDQALKLLPPDRVGNAQLRRRFEREMQAIGQLQHPNIVTVYDAGVIDDTPFITMELLEGQSLAEIAKSVAAQGKRLSVKQAVKWIVDAARGIEHAHRNNVLHRDIKPANLMRDKSGRVKVLDLGLAKFMNPDENQSEAPQLTMDQQVLGTPDFMAPEQLKGRFDQRTDVYALAATLHFLLTGKVLFPDANKNLMQKALAVTSEPAPRLSDRVSGLPAELEEVVARSLSKEPDLRPSSAKQFAAALTASLAGPNSKKVEDASSATKIQKGKFWSKPRNVVVLAAIGLVGLLAGVLLMLRGPDGGTLRVESTVPDLQVVAEWVGENDTNLREQIIEPGKSTALRIGPWALKISGDQADKIRLTETKIVMKAGEEIVVQAELLPSDTDLSRGHRDNVGGLTEVPHDRLEVSPHNAANQSIESAVAIPDECEVYSVSPSGKYLLLSRPGSAELRILERKTGRLLADFQASLGNGIGWSPDEQELLLAYSLGNLGVTNVNVFSLNGDLRRFWEVNGSARVHWSPKGDRILHVLSDNKSMMTDGQGQKIESFVSPNIQPRGWGGFESLSAWSPDGELFALLESDERTLQVFSKDGGEPLHEFDVGRNGYCRFKWANSSKSFTSVNKVFYLDGKSLTHGIRDDGIQVVYSPDGQQFVTGSGTVWSPSRTLSLGDKGFFERGFVLWDQHEVITSIDRENPGRYREFSLTGEMIREVKRK
jgi:serine/threonine protein kinase